MERDLRVSKEMEARKYREWYRMERELRVDREREVMALKEELRRVKKEKKRLYSITNNLQGKLNVRF